MKIKQKIEAGSPVADQVVLPVLTPSGKNSTNNGDYY